MQEGAIEPNRSKHSPGICSIRLNPGFPARRSPALLSAIVAGAALMFLGPPPAGAVPIRVTLAGDIIGSGRNQELLVKGNPSITDAFFKDECKRIRGHDSEECSISLLLFPSNEGGTAVSHIKYKSITLTYQAEVPGPGSAALLLSGALAALGCAARRRR